MRRLCQYSVNSLLFDPPQLRFKWVGCSVKVQDYRIISTNYALFPPQSFVMMIVLLLKTTGWIIKKRILPPSGVK